MSRKLTSAGMKRPALLVLFVSCACLALCVKPAHSVEKAAAEEYLLYVPESLGTGETPRDDGVLVKKILIRRGDTLAKISRQYSGKGHYYPQILLFNRIANPDLIHAGRELRVPVRSHPSRKVPVTKGAAPAPAMSSPMENEGEAAAYRQAFALFSAGNYPEAIEAFTRFLDEHPRSPWAPDARLYRADCYLRLSP